MVEIASNSREKTVRRVSSMHWVARHRHCDAAISLVQLKDRWVHFQVRDVYHPEPASVLTELHGADLFQGLVVDLTDGGDQGRFAVVAVEGLKQPLIIAVRHILGVL
jgi:hypothetical protein